MDDSLWRVTVLHYDETAPAGILYDDDLSSRGNLEQQMRSPRLCQSLEKVPRSLSCLQQLPADPIQVRRSQVQLNHVDVGGQDKLLGTHRRRALLDHPEDENRLVIGLQWLGEPGSGSVDGRVAHGSEIPKSDRLIVSETVRSIPRDVAAALAAPV